MNLFNWLKTWRMARRRQRQALKEQRAFMRWLHRSTAWDCDCWVHRSMRTLRNAPTELNPVGTVVHSRRLFGLVPEETIRLTRSSHD